MQMRMLFLVLVSAVFVLYGHACSWDNCFKYSNDPNIINVHLVCHSHDDMGWLKTVDDYYTGRTKSIENVGVEYIYNTVIQELAKDPNKKFSFAEVGYLTRWLEGRDKNDPQVIKLKDLVKNGQVEFIGGGWVQNDEAAAHYIDIVGQYSFGANKLLDYFGKCVPPKIAWQVDPFGHSREHANIVALFGYEGLIHGRMHYQDLADRRSNKSLDYLWVTSDDLKMELPTTAFYSNMYHSPPNFCFDSNCEDDPVVDDEKLEGYNVNEKRDDFINKIKTQAESQQHNHVLVTLGGDFQYSDANVPFTSYDRLIKAVNAVTDKTSVQVFYSTPSCYMQTVNKIADKLTRKVDDHYPYASSAHSYWSGYFTSKPEHKYMIRQLSNLLQLGKAMRVFGNLTEKKFADAEEVAERALSLSQHHDAVTGTSKEKVTQDYERRLKIGANGIQKTLSNVFEKITSSAANSMSNLRFCSHLYDSKCELFRNDSSSILMTVFNGNSHPIKKLIQMPTHSIANVFHANLEKVEFEVSKSFYTSELASTAPYQLSFNAELLPFTTTTYLIRKASKISKKRIIKTKVLSQQQTSSAATKSIVLENSKVKLTFDSDGLTNEFTNKELGKTFKFHQSYYYYFGIGGQQGQQSSGAYIFRPNDTTPLWVGKPFRVEFVKGKTFQEVRQLFNSWVSQTIRLADKSDLLEFQFLIGPIPKESKDPVAKEVISRFNVTEIKSANTFYTDSNGRQMMERKLGVSPTFKRENTEPIAGNLYPVASTIYVRDKEHQMTVSTDRSQAGGSFGDGNIDLMIHRRCFHDDNFGVDEALDEPGKDGRGLVISGSHIVQIGKITSQFRQTANEIYNKPIIAISSISGDFEEQNIESPNALINKLPEQVKILTLKLLNNGKVLLRLENFYQLEDGKGSAHVNLTNLFTAIKINKVNEVSLANTKTIKQMSLIEAQSIELKPMEIRTFELEVQHL